MFVTILYVAQIWNDTQLMMNVYFLNVFEFAHDLRFVQTNKILLKSDHVFEVICRMWYVESNEYFVSNFARELAPTQLSISRNNSDIDKKKENEHLKVD